MPLSVRFRTDSAITPPGALVSANRAHVANALDQSIVSRRDLTNYPGGGSRKAGQRPPLSWIRGGLL